MPFSPIVAEGVLADRSKAAGCELALLAVLTSALTFCAVRAFPVWDDAFTLMDVDRGGAQAVFDSMPDRPVLGTLFFWLVRSGHLVGLGAMIHWLALFGTGWVTLRLWKVLFPSRPELALPAACIALAPLLYRLQLVLINPVLAGLLGPLLTWLVVLPLLVPTAATMKPLRTAALHVVMVVAVVCAAMISEYALPTAIAGAVLLAGLGPRHLKRPKQMWITITLLLASAAAGYAVYHHLGNAEFRRGIRPEFQDWGWRVTVIGPRLLSATWEASCGMLLERIGEMDFSGGKDLLVGLLAGLVGAAALAWVSRRYRGDFPPDDDRPFHHRRVLLTLLAAIVAGMLPIVAMGQELRTWSGSRLFATILPVECCVGVALLSLVMRRWLWRILPAAIGLLAVYYIASDCLLAMHERQAVERLGEQLLQFVPDEGMTVAFVDRAWRYPRGRAANETELTKRLTMKWPAERIRHFWAFAGAGPAFHDPNEVSPNLRQSEVIDPFGRDPRLIRPWIDHETASGSLGRIVADERTGPEHPQPMRDLGRRITQLMFVKEDSAGKIHVARLLTVKGALP